MSAFCQACQPYDTQPQPRGGQCYCGACGILLASLADFDRHQERYPRDHRSRGAFTGRCSDPAAIGLELRGSTWGTPEGNAKRAAAGVRLHAPADVL
jgi:hypothetical protein